MKKMIKLNSPYSFFACILLVIGLMSCNQQQQDTSSTANKVIEATKSVMQVARQSYNAEGELMLPTGYRKWVYVGTPVTPNELNPPEAAFPEFHNVYIHPDDFAHYEKTGKFQDGTILVKELVSARRTKHVSGDGYFMGEFQGLEACIKDSKRYKDEPGNWAYYSFGHSLPLAKTATQFPAAACNACHQAAAADDFVFTQDYPVLRAAKNSVK